MDGLDQIRRTALHVLKDTTESLRFSTVLPLLICISLVPFISFIFTSLSVLVATVVGVILHILLAGSRQQFASSAVIIGTLLSR